MKQPLAAKATKNLPIIKKTVITLEKLHSGELGNLKCKVGEDQATAVANLVMFLNQIQQKHADAFTWAVTYGVEKPSKKRMDFSEFMLFIHTLAVCTHCEFSVSSRPLPPPKITK